MRTSTSWTLALATLACGSGLAAAAVQARPRASATGCAPTHGKVLTRDSRATVYALSGRSYGCVRGRRPVALGTARQNHPGQSRVGGFVLSGSFVGYHRSTCGVDTCSSDVVVRQLAGGRVVRDTNAFTGTAPPEGVVTVTAMVLRGSSVAWVAGAQSIAGDAHPVYEVDRVDRHGAATLDRGAAIGPHSLTLSGTQLRWRDGGTTRTASLD